MEWLQEGDKLGWKELRSWKASCYLPGTWLGRWQSVLEMTQQPYQKRKGISGEIIPRDSLIQAEGAHQAALLVCCHGWRCPNPLAATFRALHCLANGPAEPLLLHCGWVAHGWSVTVLQMQSFFITFPYCFCSPSFQLSWVVASHLSLCSKSYLHILLLGIESLA